MEIRVLGCGGGAQQGIRTTALLVDDDLLLDAGSGVGDLTAGEMARIRHVYLTHSHLDHVAFLPLLLDRLIGSDAVADPVRVHGRSETLQALKDYVFNDVIWPDFTVLPDPRHPVVSLEPMAPGATHTRGRRSVTMLESHHAVPAAGFCIADANATVAFSGDCTTNEGLWAGLNAQPRLDHLIVEVALPDEREALARVAAHYTPRTLATDLKRLRHDPVIWLSHRSPGWEAHILLQCRDAMPERRVYPLTDGDRVPPKRGEIRTNPPR